MKKRKKTSDHPRIGKDEREEEAASVDVEDAVTTTKICPS